MLNLTLDQFRTTLETGGVLSVSLVAQGGEFHIEAETRRGSAVLTKARGKSLRQFRNVTKALAMLRELGVRETRVDTRNWLPEQADLLKPSRPDSAAQLKAAHGAADLKRALEAALREADDPGTVWIEHDALFDALESSLAD